MKKFIFSLLVISSAVFGKSMSELNTTEGNVTESSINVEYIQNQGLDAYNEGNYPLAIKLLSKDIKSNPSQVAYSYRGISYYKLKQYDLSIKDLNKAIELDSDNPLDYTNLLELSIVINKEFNPSLENKLIEIIKDDKEASSEYEMLKILQSISTNNTYNLTPQKWTKKYKNIKIEGWDFEDLDEWSNNTKDKNKKAKLKNAIKIFKTHL